MERYPASQAGQRLLWRSRCSIDTTGKSARHHAAPAFAIHLVIALPRAFAITLAPRASEFRSALQIHSSPTEGFATVVFADPDSFLFVCLAIFLLPVGVAGVLALWALPAWLRATRVGAGLAIFEVVGMKLRRIDVDHISAAIAIARRFGVEVSHVDLQRAAAAGANPYDVAAAWAVCQRKQLAHSFEELIALEREGQLSPLLEAAAQLHAEDAAMLSDDEAQ
jgi:hypothetical protein